MLPPPKRLEEFGISSFDRLSDCFAENEKIRKAERDALVLGTHDFDMFEKDPTKEIGGKLHFIFKKAWHPVSDFVSDRAHELVQEGGKIFSRPYKK